MAGGNRKGRRATRHGGEAPSSCCSSCCAVATAVAAVVLLLVGASALLIFTVPPQTKPTGPREPVELAIGVAGHERWLDAVRAWAKLAWFKLRPPPPGEPGSPPASVKVAAKKSLQMGKKAVQRTAEEAARAAEEALQRTTEKVKMKVSRSPSASRQHADL